MTVTTNPAPTDVKPRQQEVDALLEQMRAEGASLVDDANRTIDHDASVAKGVAAMTLFENADRLGAAITEALDAAADPDTIDLQAMKAEITRQYPSTFTVETPYVPSPGMHQWTCEDTLIELKRGRVAKVGAPEIRVLDQLKPIPSGVEATWSDFFAGAGGSSSGIGEVFGALVKLAVNHWPLAIETHNYNHPDTDHDQASLARTDPGRYPRTDFAWFSPECFPAGTTILTRRGIVPIEDVLVGEEVLTHKLRWRKVTATMSKISDTVIVSGNGHNRLETTAEHPFYARSSTPSRSTRRGVGREGKAYRVPRQYGPPSWVRAADLAKGHYWASPTEFGDLAVPPVGGRGMDQSRDEFWWLVGRWLGDGSVRVRTGNSEITICCGKHEAEDLAARLKAWQPQGERCTHDELRWRRRDVRTATLFETGYDELSRWLIQYFGRHADRKRMPAWALTMPEEHRRALLAGYVSADGGQYEMPDNQRPIVVCSSVSRTLAVGVRLLALSLGHKATMSLNDSRTKGIIEGREVSMRPLWRVQWSADPSPTHDQTLLEDGIRWEPVREVKPGRTGVEVFNLSVAEDESYIADAKIVHNCTYWSVARGEKCDYDEGAQQLTLALMDDEDDTPASKEEAWRSRMLMRDVVRFARHHQYKGIIVENVPDILKWAAMDRWLAEMVAEGYRYKIITLNSAFSQATGMPAPQLRDRVYVMFWKAIYKTPNWDKWLRPQTFCPGCEEIVRGIYNPKPGKRRAMRYGPRAQYTYRCPNKACRGQMVQPLVRPASTAINWDLPTQRIGDRKKPLARKTYSRIRAGLERYAEPFLATTAGHTFERRPGAGGRIRSVDIPMGTQHTTASQSLAIGPGMLVPTGGGWNDTASRIDHPMRVRTGRESEALVVPMEGRGPVSSIRRPGAEPFRAQTARHQDALLGLPGNGMLVPLRNNGNAEPTSRPMRTFAAGGYHHALVEAPEALIMRNNLGGAEMCTPVDEPVRTLTTAGHQSVIGLEALYSYDTGGLRPLAEQPMPSQTTVGGDAVIGGELGPVITDDMVDACTLRMLDIDEIRAGMDFAAGYVLLGDVKRLKVRMLGNAVTRCSARDLAACLMEAVTGVETPLFEMPLWLPN